MTQSTTVNDDKKKDMMALGCVAVSVVGLILGFLFPQPMGGFFSAGTLLAFVAFLLSLGTVKDHSSNLLQITAFTVSFLAMAISIFKSGMLQ